MNKKTFVTEENESKTFRGVHKSIIEQSLTFEDIQNLIDKKETNVRDITISSKQLQFDVRGKVNLDGESYRLGQTAIEQIAYYTKIPVSYIRYLYSINHENDEASILLSQNLNYGIKNISRDKVFLRIRENEIRAVLSDRYAVLDNKTFVQMIDDIVPMGKAIRLQYDGDTISFFTLIPDLLRTENDSEYGVGFYGGNCEIGRKNTWIAPAIFREICSNGVIFGQKTGQISRKVHLGQKVNIDNVKQDFELYMNAAFKELDENLINILKLQNINISDDKQVQKVYMALGRKYYQSSNDIVQFFNGFEAEKNANSENVYNAFGIIQGITRASQNYNIIRSTDLDKLAGRIVNSDWNNIIASAETIEDSEIEKVFAIKN